MTRMSTLILGAALVSAPAFANEFEDLSVLDQRVAELAASLPASASPIDRRIKLRRCPVAAELEAGAGMIAVRCVPLGWRLRVPLIGEQSPVTSNALNSAPVIRRGEAVNVTILGDDYSVSYDGIAAEDGGIGKNIRVKFSTQGPFISGTVIAAGKVQIKD